MEIKWMKENLPSLAELFAHRGQVVDERFGQLEAELEQVEHLNNQLQSVNRESNLLAKLKDPNAIRIKGKLLKTQKADLKSRIDETYNRIMPIIHTIPNRLHSSVPQGAGEEDNVIIHVHGQKPQFDFAPLPHDELGLKLGLFDFERGVKVAGSRFSAVIGAGAQMERALMNFCLDFHTRQAGFTEIFVPTMINRHCLFGTGQLPKFEEDLFKIAGSDMFMSPTAEVPVTNFHANEILEEADLPLRYCAYSSCYRSEAGSAGKDVRGYIRQKQFQKVEMVVLSKPEDSYQAQEEMTTQAETILDCLGLAYRRVLLCGADTGFSAAKCFDIEVWLPGQDKYREISSCSNCEDFQARRMNLRFRRTGGAIEFVHTLNGSGLALGRLLIAILENFQQADGSVLVPEALQGYMGGMTVIRPPAAK